MSYDRVPDLEALAACGARVAEAMNLREPEPSEAIAFFDDILHEERDLWLGLVEGLITETEIRDATMARFATWLSHSNAVEEASFDTWRNAEIVRCFEIALLGRPARK